MMTVVKYSLLKNRFKLLLVCQRKQTLLCDVEILQIGGQSYKS